MTALGTERDTLIHDLLELCVPRLGEVIGEAPTIGETRPVGGVDVPDGPVVRVTRDDEVIVIGLVVQAPDGGDPASIEGVAQTIADELVAKGPEAGYEISSASPDALTDAEALATGFEVGDRLVGTVITVLSIDTGAAPTGDPDAAELRSAGSDEGAPGESSEAALDAAGTEPGVSAPEASAAGQGTASIVAGGASGGDGIEAAVLDPALGRSLGTLSQVELNVTVQLGSAELAIRDLMALSPGSVVRVGTQIGEPFPVLVNGRIAARGDLVVVNGRLGVRIRELISG